MRFVFESVICRFSFIWRVMSFVRSFWFHFRSPASCSFRSVSPNQWDLSNPKLYPHYTEYMWLLETLKTSIYWFILKVVVFLISSHRRLCVTHVFFRKMKRNALILGTSFLHQVVPLSIFFSSVIWAISQIRSILWSEFWSDQGLEKRIVVARVLLHEMCIGSRNYRKVFLFYTLLKKRSKWWKWFHSSPLCGW